MNHTVLTIPHGARAIITSTEQRRPDGTSSFLTEIEIEAALAHIIEIHSPVPLPIFGRAFNVPYPTYCRHPEKCDGAHICPRDPACVD